MSTLDNYIAESVSEDVSVGDIYVEQALAQLNVAYSLVASYAKDVAYVEYMAEMNGVDIYQEGFFTESDKGDDDSDDEGDKGKKEPGKLKKFGKSILSGPRKIWSFIKAAATAVATAATNLWRFITEKNLAKCAEKLRADESNKTYTVSSIFESSLGNIINITDNFANQIDSIISSLSQGKEYGEVTISAETFKFSASDLRTKQMSGPQLAVLIDRAIKADTKERLKRIIKKLKDSIDNVNKLDKEQFKNLEKGSYYKTNKYINAEVYKKCCDAAKVITDAYTAFLKDLKHISNQVLKDVKKNNKNSGGGKPEPPKKKDEGDGDGNGGGDE